MFTHYIRFIDDKILYIKRFFMLIFWPREKCDESTQDLWNVLDTDLEMNLGANYSEILSNSANIFVAWKLINCCIYDWKLINCNQIARYLLNRLELFSFKQLFFTRNIISIGLNKNKKIDKIQELTHCCLNNIYN